MKDAALIGDVGLQVIRDWVLRSNAKGPDGWIDGKSTGKLDIPANITLLPLTPRALELNPVANIRQFMRDNWLSNRNFKSFDGIVAICREARNRLFDQPWTGMSIGLHKWTHGFRLMLLGIKHNDPRRAVIP